MTSKSTILRANLLATVIAAAIAAPMAMAAGALPIKSATPAAAAPAAQAGSRLIIQYHNGRMTQALKLRTVNGAATRARLATTPAQRTGAAAPTSRYLRKLGVGADLVKLSSRLSAAELKTLTRELKADPAVKSVEVDRLLTHTGLLAPRTAVSPQLAVNDQYYTNNQWHLQDNAGGINGPAAWDVSTGAGVVVAVLDTGITAHPDMDGNMIPGYDFISDAFVSRRPTDARVPGALDYGDWEAADDCGAGRPASDSSFHGTHVAGTVAELSNNGIGMAGVAHTAQVLPVRVLGRCGGYTSDIADAIVWASGGTVDGIPNNTTPADVINMSLGGASSCGAVTQAAIDGAVSRGTTVVVAAGNSNADAAGHTPASCNNVVTVAAGRITGGRASYSNYGSKIDITGPGGGGGVDAGKGYVFQALNMSATSPTAADAFYGGMAGTSMAAPHVAGVVALMQSAVVADGGTPKTPAQIEALLKASVRAFPATPDKPIGPGLLDAPRALMFALAPPGEVPATSLANKVALPGQSGAADSVAMYTIEVPAGASLLNLMTYGGSGNASMYVSRDIAPTTSVWSWRSARPGNNETVRISSPAAGVYHVMVYGTAAYAGLTIQARVD